MISLVLAMTLVAGMPTADTIAAGSHSGQPQAGKLSIQGAQLQFSVVGPEVTAESPLWGTVTLTIPTFSASRERHAQALRDYAFALSRKKIPPDTKAPELSLPQIELASATEFGTIILKAVSGTTNIVHWRWNRLPHSSTSGPEMEFLVYAEDMKYDGRLPLGEYEAVVELKLVVGDGTNRQQVAVSSEPLKVSVVEALAAEPKEVTKVRRRKRFVECVDSTVYPGRESVLEQIKETSIYKILDYEARRAKMREDH